MPCSIPGRLPHLVKRADPQRACPRHAPYDLKTSRALKGQRHQAAVRPMPYCSNMTWAGVSSSSGMTTRTQRRDPVPGRTLADGAQPTTVDQHVVIGKCDDLPGRDVNSAVTCRGDPWDRLTDHLCTRKLRCRAATLPVVHDYHFVVWIVQFRQVPDDALQLIRACEVGRNDDAYSRQSRNRSRAGHSRTQTDLAAYRVRDLRSADYVAINWYLDATHRVTRVADQNPCPCVGRFE